MLGIESYTAVDNAAGIAAVEGADIIFIGVNDLAGSIGRLEQTGHPGLRDMVRRAEDEVLASGKVMGTVPSVWFCVLYIYYDQHIAIPDWLNWFMVVVGVIFVVNSLDSLIRLYSANLDWGVGRWGRNRYYLLHFFLQFALVMAYQFTPFRIEWVGMAVIGIYAVTYVVIFTRSHHVREAISSVRPAIQPQSV